MIDMEKIPPSIALFIGGALFILLGLSGGFKINNFDFQIQDMVARIILSSIGVFLAGIAIYFIYLETSQKLNLRRINKAADSTSAKSRGISSPMSIFSEPDKKYAYDLFVLMPFTVELKPIYDNHIKKVAKKLNLSIARADDFFSQKEVMQEIWSAITQASILIADCTDKNPNVFYEIGLAHAIGKPVILITQNPDNVPFDIRHRRYIQYAYTPPGMENFESHLSSTILETKKDLDTSP